MRRQIIFAALFFYLVVQTLPAGQTSAATIPQVHASALSGEEISLPASFDRHPAVLVLGFSQGSRADVTAWGKRLAADFHDSKTIRYYEMPVLAGVPKFLRGFVLKRIAADVPDRAKPHIVPIYDQEPGWRAVAGYGKPDDAYVLVVDGSGGVRWHTQGPVTEDRYREIKQRLQVLLAL